MKKFLIALLSIVLIGSAAATVIAQENLLSDNTPASNQIEYDFYSSGATTMTLDNGNIIGTSVGEQKAIVKNFNSRVFDVSFTLTPSNGLINGGLYFFADTPVDTADGINALNVNIDKNANDNFYKVYIYDFKHGYQGAVANTIALTFNGKVDVRVVVDEEDINVYLDGSNVPSLNKKVKATTHTGDQIGFRSQYADQTFSNISISETAVMPECETVKVLMVGNSYAQDTMTYAHEIARAQGINMVCGVIYYGGCTVEQHSNFIAQNKAVYTYFKNGGTDRASVDFYDILNDEDWDVITIQTGQGKQGVKESFYPYLPQLIALIENRLPEVEVGLFQSWAVPSCYEGTGNSRLSAYDDNSEKMYQAIIKTFSELKSENGVSFVVPSAEALHSINNTSVCDNSVAATSFFRDSTAHVNEKGRYMMGLTIFKSVTGLNVNGNSYTPVGYTYGDVAAPTASERAIIQTYVEKVFETDYTSVDFVPAEEITLSSLRVENAKTEYTAGEYFDFINIKVYAVYSDGSEQLTGYFNIDLMRRLTVSDTQIVITYQDQSLTLPITVR